MAFTSTAVSAGRRKCSGGRQADTGADGTLRERVQASLAECEVELRVSGVPEALQLSALLQVCFGDIE